MAMTKAYLFALFLCVPGSVLGFLAGWMFLGLLPVEMLTIIFGIDMFGNTALIILKFASIIGMIIGAVSGFGIGIYIIHSKIRGA